MTEELPANERKGVAKRVANALVGINKEKVLSTARAHGLRANSIQDLRDQASKYVFIEKLSQRYANNACRLSAVTGALSGLGGFVTTLTLGGVDIANMATQLYRLNQKIAVLHGFDPENEVDNEESILIYVASLGIDTTANSAIRLMVKSAAKEGVAKRGAAKSAATRLIMEIVKQLGVKITKAQAVKVVPVVASAAGGGLNYFFASRSSKIMMRRYKDYYFDRWQVGQ